MQYRQLGASPLQVSALCLGTMMFADQTDLQEAATIVADARAQGVNFIDTADIYSKGESERMVGQLLQGQRDDWVLATKLGNAMGSQPNEGSYSRAWMLRSVEAACSACRPTASTSSTCTATAWACSCKSRSTRSSN